MRVKWGHHAAMVLLLCAACATVVAEEWKNIAKAQGVELTYEAVGNLARLRFINTNREPVTVKWTASVQLVTGKQVKSESELNLDAGETVIVAGGPYRDNGNPVEVRSVSGTLHTKKR